MLCYFLILREERGYIFYAVTRINTLTSLTHFINGNLYDIAMECRSSINFEKLCDICSSKCQLFEYLFERNLLFDFAGKCERCSCGNIKLYQDKTKADDKVWRCDNRNCTVKFSVRNHSFFSGSKLSLEQITKLIYFWTYKYPQEIVLHETGLSNHSVIDFYNFCREVCSVIVEEQSEPIGGVGKVVEIDESKFGKRKYNRGKRVEGVWVFGGIERDSNPPKCFFAPVQDRSADTLIPIIKRWILPGTIIASDCWKAYSSLQSEGYIHQTVNHSIQFISDSGTHTNHIESRWNSLKKSLPRFGTTKELYNSYFAEYCIRCRFLQSAADKFLEFLRLVSFVYHPPAVELLSTEPSIELLATPTAPSASAQCAGATVCESNTTIAHFEVGNFDLGFSLSSDESDNDISGDLFL